MALFSSSETLQEAIDRTGGRSRGFDYLRLLLSISVLVWHSARTSYPGFAMTGVLRPLVGPVLPMFFALSGYLISGSLTRSRSVHEFAILRAVRIVPALAVETVISALVIGTLLTTVPLGDFFRSHQTHSYFLNILGYPHYLLPGVFESNPVPRRVNGSIWTIPFELECYLLIALLMVTTIVKRPKLLLAIALALQALLLLSDYRGHRMMDLTWPVSGRALVLSFLFGVVIYAFRKRVRLNFGLMLLSVVAMMLMLLTSTGSYFVPLPAAYATIYLGMRNPPKIPVVMDGDYSYGIYLYSYPLQQTIAQLLPEHRHWYVNAPLALVGSSLCAAFSWNCVEKHALKIRKPLVAAVDDVVDRLLGRRRQAPPAVGSVLDIKALEDHYPNASDRPV